MVLLACEMQDCKRASEALVRFSESPYPKKERIFWVKGMEGGRTCVCVCVCVCVGV